MKNEENNSEKKVNWPGKLGNKIWFPEAKHFFPTIFDSSPNAICQPKRGRFLSLYVILMFVLNIFYKKNHLWFWYIFTKCVEYPASLSKPGSVGKWVGSPVGLILKMVKFHLLVNPFLPFLHSDFFHWDLFTVLAHQYGASMDNFEIFSSPWITWKALYCPFACSSCKGRDLIVLMMKMLLMMMMMMYIFMLFL